jgi:CHASE2 domain-containing sensor protein
MAIAPDLKRTLMAMVAGLLPIVLVCSGLTDIIDPTALRGLFAIRGQIEAPSSTSIVRLDGEAYSKVKRMPGQFFPRRELAAGLRKITDAGAKLIIIDGIVEQPSDDPEADRLLADAIAATPTVVGRASEIVNNENLEDGSITKKRRLIKPMEMISQAAKQVVQTELQRTNGVVEEICLSNDYNLFSVERVPLLAPLRQFISQDLREPGGRDFINFYGPPSSLRSISFAKLMEERPASDFSLFFKDRVVFIGEHNARTGGESKGTDLFRTTASFQDMFGVEILATISANLIDGSWIKRYSRTGEIIILGMVSFATIFIVFSVGVTAGSIVAVAATVGWSAFSYFAFVTQHLFVPVITYVVIVSVFVVLRAIFSSKKNKRRSSKQTAPASAEVSSIFS